jgi:hypothetical protein
MSKTILYTTDESTAIGIREAGFEEILAAAREQMSLRVRHGTNLSSPKATRDYLALKLGSLEREVFAVIFLDLCGVHLYVHNSCKQPRNAGFPATLLNIRFASAARV